MAEFQVEYTIQVEDESGQVHDFCEFKDLEAESLDEAIETLRETFDGGAGAEYLLDENLEAFEDLEQIEDIKLTLNAAYLTDGEIDDGDPKYRTYPSADSETHPMEWEGKEVKYYESYFDIYEVEDEESPEYVVYTDGRRQML